MFTACLLLTCLAPAAGEFDLYAAEDYDKLAREAWARVERDRKPVPPPAPPPPPRPPSP